MKTTSNCLFALLLWVISVNTLADWRGYTTLVPDSLGKISVPIEGSDSFWILLNQCYLDGYGFTRSGQSINYIPRNYGDIFFFQQFRGESSKLVETIVYLELAGRNYCNPAWREQFTKDLPIRVTRHSVAQTIKDVFDRIKKDDPTLDAQIVIGRFPKAAGSCPATLTTTSNVTALASCLDLTAIHGKITESREILETFPSPAVSSDFLSRNYQIRKPFSTSTIKTSIAFVATENTAVNTVYLSINPAVVFLRSEKWSRWLDPITVDLGLAKPVGDTASERFESADQHYMFGLGYELSDSFSFHVGHLMSYHSDGKTETNTVYGISLDLLSLASKFK